MLGLWHRAPGSGGGIELAPDLATEAAGRGFDGVRRRYHRFPSVCLPPAAKNGAKTRLKRAERGRKTACFAGGAGRSRL